MKRLERLPLLFCWLLCLFGAAISSSAAWVGWLGAQIPTIENLNRMLPVAEALGLRRAPLWLLLAELEPEREEQHLRRALECDARSLPALLRLSLIEEFRGNGQQARWLQDQALAYHRSYKSYMAALTQAGRVKDYGRLEWIARKALQYCPRDADGVYAQLGDLEIADRVLEAGGAGRQEDYLRFLIGQKRVEDALVYQSRLPRSDSLDRRRLELCELLFWQGKREQASELFAAVHPEFAAEGVYNTRLRSRPSSLAFDWRLTGSANARVNWRPGELELKLGRHAEELELVSIFVETKRKPVERVVPLWNGETAGLYWKVDEAGPRWKRVALVAPPGQDRRFQLQEVRFE